MWLVDSTKQGAGLIKDAGMGMAGEGRSFWPGEADDREYDRSLIQDMLK
jgi:hypothetical protein